jgi:signal transduction histidine kinase
MKHSNAKNVFINLSNQNGFILQVRDDGQGFDYESIVHSNKASGLRNILNRTKIAELGCLVESTIGNGCSYKIDCL